MAGCLKKIGIGKGKEEESNGGALEGGGGDVESGTVKASLAAAAAEEAEHYEGPYGVGPLSLNRMNEVGKPFWQSWSG